MDKNNKEDRGSHDLVQVVERRLKGEVDINDLRYTIKWINDPEMIKRVAEQLLKQELGNLDLLCIIRWINDPEIKKRAFDQLLKRNPATTALRIIFEKVPEMRKRVAEELIKRGANDDEFHLVLDLLLKGNEKEIGDLFTKLSTKP